MCKYRHIEGGAVERNSRKIIQRLKKDGYVLVSIVGSHHKYSKGERTVIVPHSKKDLTEGTARSIAKQAGWI
jgi:predicted RNA binding protein YcfA (HicA-like mRNA interferase family)